MRYRLTAVSLERLLFPVANQAFLGQGSWSRASDFLALARGDVSCVAGIQPALEGSCRLGFRRPDGEIEWFGSSRGARTGYRLRMRRDFRQLLMTIQAVAFLYQSQRGRTLEGWVEATVEDFAVARQLLETVFDALAADGITAAVRQTVVAINSGEEVSHADLVNRSTGSAAAQLRSATGHPNQNLPDLREPQDGARDHDAEGPVAASQPDGAKGLLEKWDVHHDQLQAK